MGLVEDGETIEKVLINQGLGLPEGREEGGRSQEKIEANI